MSFYEMAHRQISKLGLNRFKWFGEIRKRTIPLLNDLSKPIKINNSFYMFTDNYDTLDLLANRTYEPKQTKFFNENARKGDKIALDIGANIGYFSLLFAGMCSRVYAFEPEEANYKLLSRNIKLNGFEKKIVAEQLAVSDRRAKLQLELEPYNRGAHRITNQKTGKNIEGVQAVSMDDYFKGKRKPDYIKMDVEGYEDVVIKGGKDVFKSAKLIVFEDTTGKARKAIAALGFKVKPFDNANFYAKKT
jgi:FkbM family methyltransferase